MNILLFGNKKENYNNFLNVFNSVIFVEDNADTIDNSIKQLLKTDQNIIIADIDTVNEKIINKIEQNMNKNNMLMKLSGIKNWDFIIKTFLDGQLFYLKPLKINDFLCLFEK